MTIQEGAGPDARRRVARLRVVRDASEVQRSIAAEVRAEMARQQVTDVALATAMGQQQQWFSRRKTGAVAFSAAELLIVSDYLGVPVTTFFNASGPRPVGPDGGQGAPECAAWDSNPEPTGSGRRTTLGDVVPLQPRRRGVERRGPGERELVPAAAA